MKTKTVSQSSATTVTLNSTALGWSPEQYTTTMVQVSGMGSDNTSCVLSAKGPSGAYATVATLAEGDTHIFDAGVWTEFKVVFGSAGTATIGVKGYHLDRIDGG
tara:strand:- start:489 stop:800 length:312 start_codon:yes stop_codon:yes gene_type:complete